MTMTEDNDKRPRHAAHHIGYKLSTATRFRVAAAAAAVIATRRRRFHHAVSLVIVAPLRTLRAATAALQRRVQAVDGPACAAAPP